MKSNLTAILLAAGRGTRMAGKKPKVLRDLCGDPIIIWDIKLIKGIDPLQTMIVLGHDNQRILRVIRQSYREFDYCIQKEQLGTAHSLKVGLESLKKKTKYTLVLFGDDSGLYTLKTMEKFIESHIKNCAKLSIVVLKKDKPQKVGGIELDSNYHPIDVLSYIEMEERNIKENYILCGAFCFDTDWLYEHIYKIKKGKTKGEFPLPVLIKMAAIQKEYANLFLLDNDLEWNSVNTQDELDVARRKKKVLLKQ